MKYESGKWFNNDQEVKQARVVISADDNDLIPNLFNWPGLNDYAVEISIADDSNYLLEGEITQLICFIYKYILHFDYTNEQVLLDKDLETNINLYLRKVW